MAVRSHIQAKQEDADRIDILDAAYMRIALACAKVGQGTPGASPIGAIIVVGDKIISEGFNESEMRCDPTAHAEIVVIRRACDVLQTADLRGATLYTTLQPCGMCSLAAIWAKINRIVCGAQRGDVHEMYFEERDRGTVDYIVNAYREDITLRGGVLS